VHSIKNYLAKEGHKRPRAAMPYSEGYRPEVDVTLELNPEWEAYVQSQIGVLRWCAELCHIDLMIETSMLVSYLALPR
jgi:hypothetical protein